MEATGGRLSGVPPVPLSPVKKSPSFRRDVLPLVCGDGGGACTLFKTKGPMIGGALTTFSSSSVQRILNVLVMFDPLTRGEYILNVL